MPHRLRHAICNEIYRDWDFAAACRHMRSTGYAGIEIAPCTLSDDPASIPAAARAEYRRIITDEGLEFVGLHWILVAPKGLHATTPDAALRARTWDYIARLADLCADLSPTQTGGRMVFGSPMQRSTTGGCPRADAMAHFTDGLASIAPRLASRGVQLLVEALPLNQCDVINSLAEAVAIVNAIASPAVATMFDTHNAVDEVEPHAVLVRRYYDLIRHIHVNEVDGAHCGAGNYDFAPLLRTLAELRYAGWVSLEAFDFDYGAERIAAESLAHLRGLEDAG